ncbi:retrovirus-related pol polyprotein from transposon 17.6 [Plakobranchus ocellatus]|uniref:Retrovirus-related pol polyprotein from transposon 17.6 n=1 Tax=Plakobranchus ocellatus TaxID=259542 RepID=A0AAV4D824_9GAST|nr:retrovirus-related pol polyprotein from transposon 17.6 [Plakobranchus ocellatus]
MIKQNIIRPSSSPYSIPINIVNKKNNEIRLCIDFRKLNSITAFDCQSIPTLDELLNKLNSATYFAKLDLTKRYWQIQIKEDHKKYTAFRSHKGLMELNFMPFGLSTASSTFQLAMSHALRDRSFVVLYFDDVLIFSEIWSSHMKNTRAILTALKNANLTVRPSKTHIGFDSIDFLGHIISQGKVLPDKDKTNKYANCRLFDI